MTLRSDENQIEDVFVLVRLKGTVLMPARVLKSQNARGLTGLTGPASTCTPIQVNISVPDQCPDLHDLLLVCIGGEPHSQARGTVLRCLRVSMA